MNRPIDRLIEEAGLNLHIIERQYANGPRMLAHVYSGVAAATSWHREARAGGA